MSNFQFPILFLAEVCVKTLSFILRVIFRRGGATWPGELVLRMYPNVARNIKKSFRHIVYVVGTNGKTTTAKLLCEVLQTKYTVIANPTGANLLNGIISAFFLQKKLLNWHNYVGVFEVDEYSFPSIFDALGGDSIIMLNVVRDQLDRYGEVDSILARWKKLLEKAPQLELIANASDAAVYSLIYAFKNTHKKIQLFGVPDMFLKKQHQVFGDFEHCPRCAHALTFDGRFVSHIGKWHCTKCNLKPDTYFLFSKEILKQYPHVPDYLLINAQAVYLVSQQFGILERNFFEIFSRFSPAFGRGEKINTKKGSYSFYLGKNPASWTVALENISAKESHVEQIIFGLNNRIPDGHDVSWIWDISITNQSYFKGKSVYMFGTRAYDMAKRLSVEGVEVKGIYQTFKEVYKKLLHTQMHAVILANYSAMLEARRAVTGRAIG